MAKPRRQASFAIPNNRALRRLGLSGDEATVGLEGTTLILSDADGRSVVIPASRVDRLRQFRMEPVQSLHYTPPAQYETKVWWDRRRTPVLLIPLDRPQAYRRIVRTFAAQISAARGLDRIRLGPGLATGIINLLIVGPVCLLLFAYVFYLAVVDGGWWWPGAVATLLIFSWLGGRNIVSRWPRRLRSIDRLDAELPGSDG